MFKTTILKIFSFNLFLVFYSIFVFSIYGGNKNSKRYKYLVVIVSYLLIVNLIFTILVKERYLFLAIFIINLFWFIFINKRVAPKITIRKEDDDLEKNILFIEKNRKGKNLRRGYVKRYF